MPNLSPEKLQVLTDIKLDFYRDEDLRDQFIEKMLMHYPELAITLFELVKYKNKILIEWNGTSMHVDADGYALVSQHANREGGKIEAIRQLRTISNLGLKDAKDYIEAKWPNVSPVTRI